VFEVAQSQPGFEIAGDPSTRPSVDSFTASKVLKGIDSSQFQLESPPENPVKPAPAVKPVKHPEEPSEHKAHAATGSHSGSSASTTKKGTTKTKEHPSSRTKLAEADRHKKAAKPDKSEQHVESPEKKGTLPEGFTPIAAAGQSPLGLPLRIRCEKDGSEMALVTGGASVLGHNGGPPESSPEIRVVLDSFYMDTNEVTLRQYERFREESNEEKGRNFFKPSLNHASGPDYPVLGVTLLQAQSYARWAGKEIPTEAEWERAARGEAGFRHPWGNGRAIWKQDRRLDEIDPVRSFQTDASPFGIYDLAGNAREWCADRYSPTAFSEAADSPSGQLRNWKGARKAKPEDFHVVKGNGPNWDVWYRRGMDSTQRHPDVGFRCVLRLSQDN
jgi:formylglycine-generating enzyme required for sulfatase activity